MSRFEGVPDFLWPLTILTVIAATVAAWAAFAPFAPRSRELAYVIPQGTSDRVKAGEPLSLLPPAIRLTLGVLDVLVIKNEDGAVHQVGPVLLGPRQTYRIPFLAAATFRYACSLHASGQLAITIEPTPAPGWERFQWRVANLGGQ